MKRWTPWLLILLCVCITGRAFADDPAETAIKQVLSAQMDAWNSGDIDNFARGYKDSPDTLFIGKSIARGYTGMLARYKTTYPNKAAMGTLSFTEVEVHSLDLKYAVAIGKFHLDRTKAAGGDADGIFSLVFEKTPLGWKIILDHSS
ncbi:MAG: YybH family protein [Acidobacteriaceae bacterium]